MVLQSTVQSQTPFGSCRPVLDITDNVDQEKVSLSDSTSVVLLLNM